MKVSPISAARQRRHPSDLSAAPWITEWISGKPLSTRIGTIDQTVIEGPAAALVSVRVLKALAMDATQFENATIDAYRCIRSSLAGLRHPHPVRFWNCLPAIHAPMDSDRDRYMVFNAGRFTALSEWFNGPEHLPDCLPAASGVGHDGSELVIHCLAFERPGRAVENPRQIPAFRYSKRYGPRPPCFARATVVPDPSDGQPLLFVAGTASIRGEQSVHQNDLPGQLGETVANLRALIGAAEGLSDPATLCAFTDLRVYYVREPDADMIETFIQKHVGHSTQVEMVRADICRADLLVEIEGVARLRRWRSK